MALVKRIAALVALVIAYCLASFYLLHMGDQDTHIGVEAPSASTSEGYRPAPVALKYWLLPAELRRHDVSRSLDVSMFAGVNNRTWLLQAPMSAKVDRAMEAAGAVGQTLLRQRLEEAALRKRGLGDVSLPNLQGRIAQQQETRALIRSAACGALDVPLAGHPVFHWLENVKARSARAPASITSTQRAGRRCNGTFVVGKRKDFDETVRTALHDLGMCEAGRSDEIDFYLGEPPEDGAVVKAKSSAAIGWIPGIREAAGMKHSLARLRESCWKTVASDLCDFTSPGFSFERKGRGQPLGQYHADRHSGVGPFRDRSQSIARDELKHNPFPQLWVLKRQQAHAQFGMKMLRLDEDDVKTEEKTARWLQQTLPDEAGAWTVQEYVRQPLTYKGRKFDVRAWAVLTGLNPLRLTLKRGFFPKVSTRVYNPSVDHQKDYCMHLHIPTGPECIVKRHPKPYPTTTTYSTFYRHLSFGRSVPQLEAWENMIVPQIERILSLVVLLARPKALKKDEALAAAGANYRRFLVLSPDFIVDSEGRVSMIELNTNGNLLAGVGSRLFKTADDVATMVRVLGAAGYPKVTTAANNMTRVWEAFCSTKHADFATPCTSALADAVTQLHNEEVAALHTKWYRIFPALLSDSHEPLVRAMPDSLLTPLDRALHAFLRFRAAYLRDLQ